MWWKTKKGCVFNDEMLYKERRKLKNILAGRPAGSELKFSKVVKVKV